MGSDDPLKIAALEKMPLLEYFMLIDKKLSDLKKQAQKPNDRKGKK